MLLIVSMVYSLLGFFPAPGKTAASKSVPIDAETGIGGGVVPENQTEVDLELAGIPEPEEYSRPHMLTFSSYTMEKGDIIGNIAARTGLNEDTLISVNNIKNTRLIPIGQVIRIPNQDGIYYTVKTGDTLTVIAEK